MSEEIRVGVFVCDCGSNIAGFVDVPAVVEYARGLPHVALADEGRWSCSVDYLARLQQMIKDQNLNRVVIASCTPRTHEPLFKNAVREAGLNPYLLEFVSVREQ
ncbi:MAG: heterodisulfide reductase, partial [Thermodesulfobacteriota bacterium]